MGTPDPNEELLREINRLHKEREDLAKERAKLEGRAPEADSPAAVELAQLRQRLAVVLQRLAATPPPAIRPPANTTRETTANPREFNPAGPAVVTSPISGRPLGDPFLQAQALFRGGKYKDALAAYRALQPESLNSDERLLVQYLCACCLRKLGKLDEAATLYRQVADAREDDFLTECSLWHLGTIGWRRDIEKQLADVRAACQAR
jgi:tetratricopeptide (TPR) repeat protein